MLIGKEIMVLYASAGSKWAEGLVIGFQKWAKGWKVEIIMELMVICGCGLWDLGCLFRCPCSGDLVSSGLPSDEGTLIWCASSKCPHWSFCSFELR